ncbi:glycoside hydrolase family 13 protein [Paenibacillus kribbensis]|uniref:glycoside hydrolase family 13 protein n=1 Tax=Paenibacillus kribbensis TaxID=172713 RepID=UPI000839824C|nr:alpha-glucosidase [Paenibacillus kribbensis]
MCYNDSRTVNRVWWKEAVVYQVYWRSFMDANGDGYGDLQGLMQKLDYIKGLGIDVIWLNPIYESPDKDNGYDISDYYRIMPKAGTMEDFRKLLAKVHELDMKLIMDLVVNHTSSEHPWFEESRSSLDNSKRDWYIWKPGNAGGPPNNWRSYFEPSTWTQDERTGEYYFHSFAKEQPDLNWENAELRREIYRMMRFWLDQGIDGFRMDVVNLLAKVQGFPDAERPEHIDYLGNNPGIHDYLQEMNREVLRHYDIMTVGEIPFVTPEDGLLYVAESRQELHTLFHFQVADDMPVWNLARFRHIQATWHEAFRHEGWNSQFLNNHDHTRQVTRYGNDGAYRVQSAKLLATMIHTLPGTPYVFQGEEIGMTGVHFPSINDYRDIAMHNKYREAVDKGEEPVRVLRDLQPLSRDNSRTPMQWNGEQHAGFTTGQPWIQANPNYAEINMERDLAAPDSIYAYYQRLISLRKMYKVMVYGDYTDQSIGEAHVYAYTRSLEEETWLIVLNHSDVQQLYELPAPWKERFEHAQVLLDNYDEPPAKDRVEAGGICLRLRPHEAVIYSIID